MPCTSRHQLEEFTASARLNTHPEIRLAPSVSMNRQPVVIAELAEELENLLAASPVDLKRVGDAVRVHPDFEALVLRLAVSLALSEDIPPATVEEAVVVLGTARMRVLVHLWAMSQKDRFRRLDGRRPEILYLLSFLHWLGQRQEDFAAESVHAGDSTTNCLTAESAGKAVRIPS
jgi:HDOD domain-containing protein